MQKPPRHEHRGDAGPAEQAVKREHEPAVQSGLAVANGPYRERQQEKSGDGEQVQIAHASSQQQALGGKGEAGGGHAQHDEAPCAPQQAVPGRALAGGGDHAAKAKRGDGEGDVQGEDQRLFHEGLGMKAGDGTPSLSEPAGTVVDANRRCYWQSITASAGP